MSAQLSPNPNAGADPVTTRRFMSVKQVADYLQINEKKVYSLASEGKIPGTKITGKWLFPRDLVDQWLLESSHGGVLTDRLILAGSDDPLLHRLVVKFANDVRAKALVSYTCTGTQLGLSLLSSRRADACAIHWGPVEESARRHPALMQAYPLHDQWVLVRIFHRQQGLMLSKRHSETDDVASLLKNTRRWVFRQDGAGSQRFLKEILAQHDVNEAELVATSHARSEREAASLIAMGEADIAPGARGAATEFGLGFVATGWEAFDLALYRGIYFRTLFQNLLEELKTPGTQELAKQLGGYRFDELGKLIWAS